MAQSLYRLIYASIFRIMVSKIMRSLATINRFSLLDDELKKKLEKVILVYSYI